MSEPLSPRARCYHKVRHAFSGAIAEYYRKNPHLLDDLPRLEAASYYMLKLMQDVLSILDSYDVADKDESV